MKKKIIMGLIAISSAGVLLGACGGSGDNKPTQTTEITTETTQTTSESTGVTTSNTTETTSENTTQSSTTVTEPEASTESAAQETTGNESEAQPEGTGETTTSQQWVLDPDTGLLVDDSNFTVIDNDGTEHVMTREEYKKWLNGEFSWD